MLELQKAQNGDLLLTERGLWMESERMKNAKAPRITFAVISCPICGSMLSLCNYHVDYKSGIVSPGVICPLDDCGFRDQVTLLDWNHYTRNKEN